MKTFAATLLSGCLALTAAGAIAADDMKKTDPMKKEMTMQECKDHMAMAKKDDATMKKDDATMKKDAMCADMMKKDSMKKDDATMKKEEPMKK